MNPLLSVPEAAELLRVKPKTLYQWIYRGVFPEKAVVRFGRTIRIKRAELVKEGWLMS